MAIRVFLRVLICCMTLACWRTQAQTPAHDYRVKDGRMTISLGAKIRRPVLDSFIRRYNLLGIGLHQLILTGIHDSLKQLGWDVSAGRDNTFLISKPLFSASEIADPAGQMIIAEKHPTLAEMFPSVNNGVLFGINRFRRKSPFVREPDGSVRFFLRGATGAKHVILSGSFDNWSPTAISMRATDSGWIALVPLDPGKYWYKFVVDGEWIVDDDNLLRENDGLGNTNSIFFVNNYVFRLPGYTNARRVFLAGSFANWRENLLLMNKTPSGWELPVYLAEGTHTYRYVVDGHWISDPSNPNSFPNEFGETNSVVRLGKPHRFELPGYTQAREVVLSGNFNHWRTDELYMSRTPTGWQIDYTLGPGNYEYRFKVDREWINDPKNPLVVHEGKKITNSYLIIGPNYTFRLKGYNGARQVILSGDFDGWSETTLGMQHQNGEWVFPIHLSAGKHLYKFIVDGQWIRDPDNPLWEQNAQGTGNSIVWIDR